MSDCPHMKVETMLQSVRVYCDVSALPVQWVVYTGYLERCAACKERLGDGYGDANYYPTRDYANEEIKRLRPFIGKWEAAESRESAEGAESR